MKKAVFLLPLIILICAAAVLIIHSSQTGSTKKITIVAGENFWGNIASQIAGNQAQVISIISNPNQDPHEYDATAADARNITNANIVIENGVGYDTFMQKILSTTQGKTVINVGDLAGLAAGDNPHMWYNFSYVTQVTQVLLQDLKKADPTHASEYTNNYNTFIESLSPLYNLCASINTKYKNTQVISTERVADYMLANCGMTLIPNDFQKAIEEGNDPSVASVNQFQTALTSHQAKVLIYNEQTVSQSTQQMESLATSEHIPIVGVTETMPLHTTYQKWMLSEMQSLQKALQ